MTDGTSSSGQPPSAQDSEDHRARLFRSLLQHANDLVYSVAIDPEAGTWRLEFLSDRIYDLSGCHPEEFAQGGALGSGGPFGLEKPDEHPFELIHPEDLKRTLEATRVLSKGLPVTREYRLRNRLTGRYRWLEDHSEVEKDERGRVMRIWGIVRDITERREREDELRQLAAIVNASDDAVIGLDRDGVVSSWNPGASELYGYAAEEVLGRSFFELVVPERATELTEAIRSLGDGRLREEDALHHARDGTAVPVAMTAFAVLGADDEPDGVAVVVRDLTARKQLELELLHSQKMEAMGRLAGAISHDFNNVLTVILGESETLLEDLARGDPSPSVDGIRAIHQAASRAAALTGRLLALSRKQRLQPTVVAVNDVVRDMSDMLERLLGDDVRVELTMHASGIVEADLTQLQQVLLNLAVNAREAMPGGGLLKIVTADVETEADWADRHTEGGSGSWVMLSLTDTGSGMDEDVLRHAFDPFFTTKPSGTGLGLSTVYGIVSQSGGHVTLASEPGAGTTATVYLPRVEGIVS